MHEKLLDAASDSGVTRNEIVRKAVAQYLTRGSPDDYRHRELVLSGTRGAYTVDKVLEWLLAKRPAVADLTMSGGELDARMKRVIRKSLPKKQAERVVLRFEGRNLDEIGRLCGCSKQAVHASLQRALSTLGQDREFIAVLISITESEFSVDELMALAREY